jgi:hypothetical protein
LLKKAWEMTMMKKMTKCEELDQYLKSTNRQLESVFVDPENSEEDLPSAIQTAAGGILESIKRLNRGELKNISNEIL